MKSQKIKSRTEVCTLREKLRASGKRVGFTSGTFDWIHAGHVEYLAMAKSQCDVLVIGLNSDLSVRSYKDPSRPICRQEERAQVLAALESVDQIFLFDETNNNKNVELLKPDFYFKAGDYQKSDLSSAPLVEQHGGQVVIIPLHEGLSSSKLFERVVASFMQAKVSWIELPPKERKPAVFLDRDGTIIEHVEYLHESHKMRVFPGAIEAMKQMKDAGFYLIIVTNQPGIGLGYFSKEDFFRVNRELLHATSKSGVTIDKVYFCPHSLSEDCPCRKPRTGMIDRAVKELNIDLARSVVIGDMSTDAALAHKAGCKGIIVETGAGGRDGLQEVKPNFVARNLADAAQWAIKQLTCSN